MFIHLFLPAFSLDVCVVQDRVANLNKWLASVQVPWRKNGWVIDQIVGWPGCEATKSALTNVDENGVPQQVACPVYEKKDVPQKGEWVTNGLKTILGKLADHSYAEHEVIILIDGSGKIDFDVVEEVARHLEEGDPLILGYRKDPCQTMDSARVEIEAFENFLVAEKFKINLVDAQCGCWGFQADMLRDFPFMAQSYGIELDVVIAALNANISPRYTPVKLVPVTTTAGTKQTDYQAGDDIKKLEFISYRLGIDTELLQHYVDKYHKVTGKMLPERYLQAVGNIIKRKPRPHKQPYVYGEKYSIQI